MKKFLMAMMMMFISYPVVSGMEMSSNGEPSTNKKDVVLSKKTSVDNNQRPRSPRKLVLDCYYEDGYIYLYTSFEIGVIDMTIRNLSTGEVLNYAQESGFGWISFPASTAEGNYMVEMETESYGDYIGYYEL